MTTLKLLKRPGSAVARNLSIRAIHRYLKISMDLCNGLNNERGFLFRFNVASITANSFFFFVWLVYDPQVTLVSYISGLTALFLTCNMFMYFLCDSGVEIGKSLSRA